MDSFYRCWCSMKISRFVRMMTSIKYSKKWLETTSYIWSFHGTDGLMMSCDGFYTPAFFCSVIQSFYPGVMFGIPIFTRSCSRP